VLVVIQIPGEITVIVVVQVAEEVEILQRQAEQEPQDKVTQEVLGKTPHQNLEVEVEEQGVLVIQAQQQEQVVLDMQVLLQVLLLTTRVEAGVVQEPQHELPILVD
jgi:hypothetical protein